MYFTKYQPDDEVLHEFKNELSRKLFVFDKFVFITLTLVVSTTAILSKASFWLLAGLILITFLVTFLVGLLFYWSAYKESRQIFYRLRKDGLEIDFIGDKAYVPYEKLLYFGEAPKRFSESQNLWNKYKISNDFPMFSRVTGQFLKKPKMWVIIYKEADGNNVSLMFYQPNDFLEQFKENLDED